MTPQNSSGISPLIPPRLLDELLSELCRARQVPPDDYPSGSLLLAIRDLANLIMDVTRQAAHEIVAKSDEAMRGKSTLRPYLSIMWAGEEIQLYSGWLDKGLVSQPMPTNDPHAHTKKPKAAAGAAPKRKRGRTRKNPLPLPTQPPADNHKEEPIP